jgi:hypothetical protein
VTDKSTPKRPFMDSEHKMWTAVVLFITAGVVYLLSAAVGCATIAEQKRRTEAETEKAKAETYLELIKRFPVEKTK